MTTKNQEFTFDLQNFANSTTYVTDTTVLTAQNVDGFTGSNQVNIAATGSGNSISVYGGWSLNDTLLTTVATEYENWGTSSQTSISATTTYGHNGDFTYYAFSGSDGSYTIDTLSAHTELPSGVAASNTYTSISSGLPNANYVTFEKNTQASPITVAGGGQHGVVSIQGVGTISDFTEGTQQIALARAGSSSLNLTGVNGAVELTANSTAFKQSINGAFVNATLGSVQFISINGGTGSTWDAPTLSAGTDSVNLGSIDTVQTWLVNSGRKLGYTNNKTNVTVAAGGEGLYISGSSNATTSNYLVATLNSGDYMSVAGSGKGDTLSVNGTILSGAAQGAAIISVDDSSIMSAKYGAANGLTVGGAASIGGAISSVADDATVTITSGIITGVDSMAAGGTWSLGANASVGQLGSDMVTFDTVGGVIAADTAGTGIATLSGNIGAAVSLTGDHIVNVNGANWSLGAADTTNAIVGSFDSVGNATVVSGASIIGGNAKSLAIGANGANDTMSLGSASQITLNSDGVVTGVNSLAAESTWLVRNGASPRTVSIGGAETISFANQSSSNVFGELTVGSNGASISAIDSLSGNVTVGASSISGLDVAGTTWTISGTSDSAASFDSTGKLASVTALSSGSDLTVTSTATDASVAVAMTGETADGTFNGAAVHVHDSDSIVGVQLESGGISGITSLNSGATVTGDNEFDVNGNFHVRKAAANVANANTQITLGGSNSITIQNVANGDAYTVTGSNGNIVYDINSLAAGGSASVGMNNATVAVTVADADTDGAYVAATTSDDVAVVGGIKLNDSVTTSGDKNFNVVYDTSDVSSSSSDTYIMSVNNANISLKADNLSDIGTAITVAVDNSGVASLPHVTISSGLAKNSTVTVGSGIYKIGSSDAVTVNDGKGFLSIDANGNVSAEDSMVADVRRERNNDLTNLVSSVTSSSVGAYNDFYNLYYNNNNVFGEHHASVASYSDSITTDRYSTISPSGVNIYGDKNLSDYPNAVTLQSYLSNSINVEHIEGVVSGQATLGSAVIDVSNSNNSVVAVGMSTNSSYENFAVNHTILGSGRQSTLLVGAKATGDNYVQGGNGGNYIVHQGNGKATLLGGTGSDTINAMAGDSVRGGTGADYFYDETAYEISDYNFDEGDVIIASKLASISNLSRENIKVEGNRLAVAGGATLTVGSSDVYDESTATRAVVANAANSNNRSLLIWAGIYDSQVNATDFAKGALIISDNNEGGADTVLGSAYADVAYVGGNDLINSGAGNDTINIASVSADSGRRGATVVLSSGKNVVNGWTGGFDNESGSNVIAFESNASTAADINFKSSGSSSNVVVVGYTDGASLNFNGVSSSNGGYNFLVGQEKVTFIASDQTVSVTSDSDIANYYKSDKKSAGIYAGESISTALNIDLNTANFVNITKLDLHNESKATVIGTADNESITVVGSSDAGANKSVAAGAGNDLIVSGGNSTANAGNALFFGVANNVTYSTGRDTVENFSFYRGSSQDMDVANADVLYLGSTDNYRGVNVTSSKLEISLGDSDKVIVSDNFSTSDNKIVRARFINDTVTYNCKFGLTSGFNTFTYDGETNAFFGNTGRGKDTLNVASDLNNVSIWLNDRNYDQKYYYGINVINAGNLTDAKSTLVGSSADSNLIYSAGSGSTNSLWGGGGESNTLIGGAGDDTFFYYKSVGYTDNDGVFHSSNDIINGVQNNDLIRLADVSLSDITSTEIVSGRISINLNNGSSLTVTGMSTETHFMLSDGSTYTAINSGNDRRWDPSV